MKQRKKIEKLKQRILWTAAFSIILGLLFGYHRQTQVHNRKHPTTWLRVLTFSDVLSQQILSDYRKHHHVRILLNTAHDVTQMESLLRDIGHQYDLIIAYGFQLKRLEHELWEMPNKWVDHLPLSADVARTPDSPNPYLAPPLLWGIEGLIINTRKITSVSTLTSWADLLRLPSLKKRIGFPNNPYELAGHLQRRNLISSDILNALTTDLGQRKMREFLDSVDLHWNAQPDRLMNDDLWAMQISNGQAAKIIKHHSHLKFILPEEGSTLWSLNAGIPKGSQQTQVAQDFINYLFTTTISKTLVKSSQNATVHRDLESEKDLEPMEKASFLRSVPVHRIRFIESVVAGQAERLERLIFQSDRS